MFNHIFSHNKCWSACRIQHHLRQILLIIVFHPHNQPHTMIQWVTKHCWTRDLLMISTTLKSGEHSGWRNHGFYHELSFLFVNAFSTLTYCPNRETLERAFRVWERVADLKFSEASEPPGDLEIRWGTSPGYVEILQIFFKVWVWGARRWGRFWWWWRNARSCFLSKAGTYIR